MKKDYFVRIVLVGDHQSKMFLGFHEDLGKGEEEHYT